ncbi:transposase [Clostridium tagluense]|nr:transposase [Clostridium tagluense]WLC68009.1 transposase [Clostridium tagluense]
MSELQINSLDSPTNYKKRESPMNDWLNIIFKMMDDGHSSETIYFYIQRQPCFCESNHSLADYIYIIGKNNFPYRALFSAKYLMESVIPPDVIVLKRTEILKYLLTCNPKVKKDETVGLYIELIKEKYPIAGRVEFIFKEFHGTIMGTDPNKLEDFLKEFEDSEIKSFCNGIKKDIAPVKNAISYTISSGFVEGNNNKFKLLKRIVYGRSGLVNLTKKCKLAFLPKNEEFSLSALI